MTLTLIQANPYNAPRLSADIVAALPETARTAWQALKVAADKQGEMSQEGKALPRRNKGNIAIWKAHDARSAAANDALIAAYRAFVAVAPIAR